MKNGTIQICPLHFCQLPIICHKIDSFANGLTNEVGEPMDKSITVSFLCCSSNLTFNQSSAGARVDNKRSITERLQVDWPAILPPGHIYHRRLPKYFAIFRSSKQFRGTPESEEIFAGMRSQPEVRDRVTLFTWVPQSKIFRL